MFTRRGRNPEPIQSFEIQERLLAAMRLAEEADLEDDDYIALMKWLSDIAAQRARENTTGKASSRRGWASQRAYARSAEGRRENR